MAVDDSAAAWRREPPAAMARFARLTDTQLMKILHRKINDL
jgi:hypothetical protein